MLIILQKETHDQTFDHESCVMKLLRCKMPLGDLLHGNNKVQDNQILQGNILEHTFRIASMQIFVW